jgi:acyl carrier protein
LNEHDVADRIERFAREQFAISPTDPRFGRDVDLFEGGYVDSLGVAEMLEFLEHEWGVAISDDELLADEFATIAGMARTICSLREAA